MSAELPRPVGANRLLSLEGVLAPLPAAERSTVGRRPGWVTLKVQNIPVVLIVADYVAQGVRNLKRQVGVHGGVAGADEPRSA